jgi:hypothetical protein
MLGIEKLLEILVMLTNDANRVLKFPLREWNLGKKKRKTQEFLCHLS